ncbi:amine sulfotransferase-like isoform X2 [Betta splendens]|uniref:Sulfotransferase n=1 Tax=Betta splendens TaxID=158456 RepID=A0A6P7KTI6_BETSP|nr:amine sulfotransferase-like isoform X2 [Betta splendens]
MMDMSSTRTYNHELVPHKGFTLISGIHDPDDVDQIYNLEIRDSDVFVITYPKSGTIWMQQILLLLEADGDETATSKFNNNGDLIPWIEITGSREAFIKAPSPRMRVTHLPYHFMPSALSQKKGKMASMLETPKDFNEFFERFLQGHVFGCSWFEHIKTWYSHKDEINALFITYEEMIQDLRSVVDRISLFLGKQLNDEQLANVVKHSTFTNMCKIPQASYEQVPEELLNHRQGRFMRKGTIGDWKNHFTVAQNERFDELFQKEMKDFPLSFIWDIRHIE